MGKRTARQCSAIELLLLSVLLVALCSARANAEPLTCISNDLDHPCATSTSVTATGEPCDTETHQCMTLNLQDHGRLGPLFKQGAGCVRKDLTDYACWNFAQHSYSGYFGINVTCSYCDTNDCNVCENLNKENLLSCNEDVDIDNGFDEGLVRCKETTLTTLGFPCFKYINHCFSASFNDHEFTSGYGCIPKIDNDFTNFTCNVVKENLPDWVEFDQCNYCEGDMCNTCEGGSLVGLTLTDVVLTIVIGLISVLSSMLVLYVIFFKSVEKLNSTYHRIMAAISFFDIIGALSMSLTTLMIPKNASEYGPLAGIFEYGFYGNKSTCRLQGFLIILGGNVSSSFATALSVYYVLTASKVTESKIHRYFEPLVSVLALGSGLTFAIYSLTNDFIHPSVYEPFCWMNTWPNFWDRTTSFGSLTLALVIFCGVLLGIIALSMCIIIFIIFRNEKEYIHMKNGNGSQDTKDSNLLKLKQTRTIMKQALMYIAAFMITWVPLTITVSDGININAQSHAMEIFHRVTIPSHGIWNMLIFIYHKVVLLRDSDASLSNFSALKTLLFSTSVVSERMTLDISGVEIQNESNRRIDNIDVEEISPSTGETTDEQEQQGKPTQWSLYDGLSFQSPSVETPNEQREFYNIQLPTDLSEDSDSKWNDNPSIRLEVVNEVSDETGSEESK